MTHAKKILAPERAAIHAREMAGKLLEFLNSSSNGTLNTFDLDNILPTLPTKSEETEVDYLDMPNTWDALIRNVDFNKAKLRGIASGAISSGDSALGDWLNTMANHLHYADTTKLAPEYQDVFNKTIGTFCSNVLSGAEMGLFTSGHLLGPAKGTSITSKPTH
jgi:hypothetical protein